MSTTNTAVDALSSNTADNLGANNTTVFFGSLTGEVPFQSQLDIIFDTTFNYDPSVGNLLLNVTSSGIGSSGPIYFDVDQSVDNGKSRLYNTGANSDGLVTGFNRAASVTVPEPLTLGLMLLGMVSLSARRR